MKLTSEIPETRLTHRKYSGSAPLDGGKDLLLLDWYCSRSITMCVRGGKMTRARVSMGESITSRASSCQALYR
jgi:hypothetical protein